MSFTLSGASIPIFTRYLANLAALLDKAEAHARAHNVDSGTLLAARLYPDMHSLTSQVQFACDFAKGAVSRLAGIAVPSFKDDESTFDELRHRIARTLDLVRAADVAAIDAARNREIAMTFGGKPLRFSGEVYLRDFAIPSFLFHVTTAYAILRHNGVVVGKADYLGQIG